MDAAPCRRLIPVWMLGLMAVILVSLPATADNAMVYSPLPPQPAGVAWPVPDWQRSALPVDADSDAIQALADQLMDAGGVDSLGRTQVLLVVQRGRIVLERYADTFGCDKITHSMSVAKMLGSVLAAKMVEEGALDLHAPADIDAWHRDPSDPRSRITPAHILRMTAGQEWNELFDFIELAFGDGYADLATYAIEQPAAYEPGSHYQYSDGAPGLISYLLRKQHGWGPDEMALYLRSQVFEPLHMQQTEAEFDALGTWYGSSGVRWSPCDLARFSLMLLRDGTWLGEPFLPAGWVNDMRTPSAASLDPDAEVRRVYGAGYGYTSFVYDMRDEAPLSVDAFGHLGFGGHVLRIVPSKDVIVMLLGAQAFDAAHLARMAAAKAISDAFPDVNGSGN
ncbi:MAG: serine hydrolase [Pseudomonadota bacterium]